jgi:hypothetical protein
MGHRSLRNPPLSNHPTKVRAKDHSDLHGGVSVVVQLFDDLPREDRRFDEPHGAV